ncbi:hypothetical protein [Legionella sp. 227]|uniref:hypothetical protein n=1 Tax=Legionella sp. 227 TaxID=3367288 RepID=UPI00370D9234
MSANAWFLGSLGIAIVVLIGFLLLFRKNKKTMQFYLALITFLIVASIFLHGVSFQLNE